MHAPHVRAEALALIEQGLNDCEVSRRLGIRRGTIRDWRRPTYVPRNNGRPRIRETCPRCWRAAKPIRVTAEDYTELLGLYLGDGSIANGPRAQRLRLEPWQSALVESAPWPLIRGLIRTDGCHFINRTDVHRPHPYEYLTYELSNSWRDIVDLFRAACARVAVFTRANRDTHWRWSVRINRRESVALMLEHVGLKK